MPAMNTKQKIYFGPPLDLLTRNEGNTMEISGRINRTAERYLGILREHSVEITTEERKCLEQICSAGFLSVEEIQELPDEVRFSRFNIDGLDQERLADKLEEASFADLVAVVESLGY